VFEPDDDFTAHGAAYVAAQTGRTVTEATNEARQWLQDEGLGYSPSELNYGLAAVAGIRAGQPGCTLAEKRWHADSEVDRLGRLARRMTGGGTHA
jgi:hypothetical protein